MTQGPPPRDDRAARDSHDRLRAIALMCVAVALFSALDASAKMLTTRMGISVTQTVWARFIVQFMGLLILVPALGVMPVRDMFRTNGLKLQLARSTLMVATTVFNFMALQTLRLDQAVTIVFLAPLVVALLAGPFLGEWVGWRRMVAILIGFCGVLVAVHPSSDGLGIGVLYSFLAMLAYALFMLLTRHMATLDPPMVTLFYSMFVGTAALTPFALTHWVSPPDAARLAAAGRHGTVRRPRTLAVSACLSPCAGLRGGAVPLHPDSVDGRRSDTSSSPTCRMPGRCRAPPSSSRRAFTCCIGSGCVDRRSE